MSNSANLLLIFQKKEVLLQLLATEGAVMSLGGHAVATLRTFALRHTQFLAVVDELGGNDARGDGQDGVAHKHDDGRK